MIVQLSTLLNFGEDSTPIPLELINLATKASKEIADPETAKAAFDQLVPILGAFAPNSDFTVACGLLLEKQRNRQGMLEFWNDVLAAFPEDLTALRMLMRWHRRNKITDLGVSRIHRMFPNCRTSETEARAAIVALGELRAFEEIDDIMDCHLANGSEDRTLKVRYVKLLGQQCRYSHAQKIASTIGNHGRLGHSTQRLLEQVSRRARKVEKLLNQDPLRVFQEIISLCPIKPRSSDNTIGTVTFFTGQLGTGGAEKQLTKLAVELSNLARANSNTFALNEPTVCVKHATPATSADFYLPTLQKAGIKTHILSEVDAVEAQDLPALDPQIANLLELLPTDISEQTMKMVRYFKTQNTNVAYLWQDGGVLAAATAALIAGVPSIVTSFRGLPPNLRPNLMRPELKPLYQILSSRDEVRFTANSQCAATAYEDWLDLSPGSIAVVPNAIDAISSYANTQDHLAWESVVSVSPKCRKTVVGIFRFDENKRPLYWVETAAKYIKKNQNTRFIILGSGQLFDKTHMRIKALGLENRIFLLGVRENVGFFLSKADLLMHLARQEGLPNVIIEAQLASRPVIATPAGGTAEIVEHGTTGYILQDAAEPSDTEILSALNFLLNNTVELRKMGQNARLKAEPKYLPANVLNQTIQIFRHRKDSSCSTRLSQVQPDSLDFTSRRSCSKMAGT